MELLFVKKFCQIEGFEFWHRHAIIGNLPFIKQNFWETYPEIKNPNEIFENRRIIVMKKKKYIIKIAPQIDFYISNNYSIPTVEKMATDYVDFETNKKIFFTLKGYSEFLEEKVQSFNLHNYNKYTFQPQVNEIAYFRIFPSLLLADESKRLASSSILADHTDSLAIRNPPIRINTFRDLPQYKKKEIIKNWTGLTRLEPTTKYKKKLAIPLFLKPTYILLEYSPYFKNENTHLRKLKKFFQTYKKGWNLHKNHVIDVIGMIDYYISQHEKKRSKLDFLVDYIKTFKPELNHLKLIRKIYGYVVVTKRVPANNGLYVVRKNGEISNLIYFLKFDSIEFWAFEDNTDKGCFKIGYQKNLYYYTSDNKKNIKIKFSDKKRILHRYKYLEIKKTFKDYQLEQKYKTNSKTNLKKLKKVDINKIKAYKLIKLVYFFKKRYYHADNIMMDIRFQTKILNGTVRPKGEKIIYIIKIE